MGRIEESPGIFISDTLIDPNGFDNPCYALAYGVYWDTSEAYFGVNSVNTLNVFVKGYTSLTGSTFNYYLPSVPHIKGYASYYWKPRNCRPSPQQTNSNADVLNAIGSVSTQINSTASTINSNISQAATNITTRLNAINSGLSSQLSNISSQISNQNNANAGAINSHIDSATQAINNNVDSRTAQLDNSIRQSQGNILSSIFSTAGNIIGAATTSSQQILGAIGIATTHSDIVIGAVKDELNTSINNIQTSIDSAINDALSSIGNFIAEQIQALGNTISGIFQPIIDIVNGLFTEAVKFWNERVLGAKKEVYDKGDLAQSMLESMFNPDYKSKAEFIDGIKDFKRGTGITSNIIMMVLSIPAIIGIVSQLVQPAWDNFLQEQQSISPDKLLSLAQYVGLYLREHINKEEYHIVSSRLGYSSKLADLAVEIARPVLGLNELRQLYLREEITKDEIVSRLDKDGYTTGDIFNIIKLFDILPPIQDLIRFTVREVFTPEIANKYGLFQDYPVELTKYAKKQGLSEQWAKSYWAAHWELPSPTQGYEMFHRGIITEDDLKLLLRALDIMPYWRDKLIQMNYNPITRVDVRRLRKYNLMSSADVEARYRAIGYSPNDAKLLARFTELDIGDNPDGDGTKIRELSTASIVQAYVRNLFTKSEAVKRLQDLHYTKADSELLLEIASFSNAVDSQVANEKRLKEKFENTVITAYKRKTISFSDAHNLLAGMDLTNDAITLMLHYADLEHEQALKNTVLASLKEAYIDRTISKTDLVNILNNYQFVPSEIEVIIRELDIVKDLRVKKPTLAQLQKFLEQGLMSLNDFIEELKGLGYADKYIAFYIAGYSPQ